MDKLWQLMEKGAEKTKPSSWAFLDTHDDGKLCACALGAAAYALSDPDTNELNYNETFEIIKKHLGISLDEINDYHLDEKFKADFEAARPDDDLPNFEGWVMYINDYRSREEAIQFVKDNNI